MMRWTEGQEVYHGYPKHRGGMDGETITKVTRVTSTRIYCEDGTSWVAATGCQWGKTARANYRQARFLKPLTSPDRDRLVHGGRCRKARDYVAAFCISRFGSRAPIEEIDDPDALEAIVAAIEAAKQPKPQE